MEPALPRPAGLFAPGRNCYAVAHADRVAFLVDGEAYFRAFAQAAERARHSIMIVAWDFNSSACLRFDREERAAGAPARVGDFLNWLARRRRGLQIFVLDWDYPMVFGTDREFPPLYGLGWTPHRRVHVRYDDTHPVAGSHHQKIVVIDGTLAFVGGLDLTARRWDTPDHCADEARRVHGQVAYPPFHDLMVAVDGDAARVLAGIARERWEAATQQVMTPAAGNGDPWPAGLPVDVTDVDLAIVRTLPPTPERPGVREVEQLYLDMIAAARHTIYIENQYFTAHRIGEALAARLTEPEGPEIILVTRLLSHGWLEEHTMHVLRTRLLWELEAADRGRRFHVYYPHIDGLRDGTCIDVHSKLMIVDDEILRIGSANLCNRSMGMDSECDVAIEARGNPRLAAVIQEFRDRLLGEHLGLPPARVGREVASRGSLYRAIEVLRGPGRSLRPLDKVPEWSETVVELARVADPERPVSLEEVVAEYRAADPASPEQGIHWARLAMVALLLAALTALWRYTPLAGLVSPERIVGWAHAFAHHPWAPLVILVAYTPASVVMFPRPLITLAAIVAFGPFPGIAYALAGGLLAAFFSYLAGRRLPRGTVRSLAGDKLNSVTDTLRRRGLMAMTAVRLVPVMPFAAVGLVAGAIHIRLWHFMLGTLLGMVPGTVTAIIFGGQIEVALRDPSQISYGLIAVALGVMALLALTMGRWLKEQSRHHLSHGGSHGQPSHHPR
ncbi:MAG: putative Phospholipase/Transphosphatidylase [Rhodocyclaceae bacterium]|nr:putative Phospholipase/Transphosphatidylase [Rhodocyclaceae bacterium]